jgi:hypothetical protein
VMKTHEASDAYWTSFLNLKGFSSQHFPVLVVSEFIIDFDERDLAKPLKVYVVVHHGLCYVYAMASDN